MFTDDPYDLSDAELIDYDGTAFDTEPIEGELSEPTAYDGDQLAATATEPPVEMWS